MFEETSIDLVGAVLLKRALTPNLSLGFLGFRDKIERGQGFDGGERERE